MPLAPPRFLSALPAGDAPRRARDSPSRREKARPFTKPPRRSASPSERFRFAVSVIGIIVFVGLTAWDAQRIKEEYADNAGGEELQIAVFCTFSHFLTFNIVTSAHFTLLNGGRDFG
jgi:hypothetical protein